MKIKDNCETVLAEIDQLLVNNRFVVASELAERILRDQKSSLKHKKSAAYAKLYAYNRMHWLVEGRIAFALLEGYQNLQAKDWFELALFEVIAGRPTSARRYFKKSLVDTDDKPLVLSEIAITYEQQGDKDKALKLYQWLIEKALKRKVFTQTHARVFARKAGLTALRDNERDFLRQRIDLSQEQHFVSNIAFTLAASSRSAGDLAQELEWLILANRVAELQDKSKGVVWDLEHEKAYNRKIIHLFDEPSPEWMPRIEARNERFIFVLGMPRSGTTLLEQILGAHPNIGNCGESRAMGIALYKAMSSLGYKRLRHSQQLFDEIKNFNSGHYQSLANYYCSYQDQISVKKIRTDKELANINNVGILANLLPNAKFIFLERSPLDNCASLMQQDFGGAPYSTNPVNCVLEHKEYRKKADHWAGLYADRFFSVKYEDLVTNFEASVGDIVQFLKIDWSEKLLTFYERNNSVRTPSISQVRGNISNASVGKWVHYRKFLCDAEKLVSGA